MGSGVGPWRDWMFDNYLKIIFLKYIYYFGKSLLTEQNLKSYEHMTMSGAVYGAQWAQPGGIEVFFILEQRCGYLH